MEKKLISAIRTLYSTDPSLLFRKRWGTTLLYTQWKTFLNSSIRLHPVELSGHGRRFQEDLYDNMADTIENLYRSIEPYLQRGPIAFFGHSMGALLTYELIGILWDRHRIAPAHAFISGRVPPNDQETMKLHRLSDTDLMMHGWIF